MTELNDLLFSFEAEHVFAQSLYADPDMRAFLESRGYAKHMLGNLKGAYSNQATVDFIQGLPEEHPFRALLLDSRSGFSLNWHRGGPTSTGAGGFQRDKNRFLQEQVQDIMDSGASEYVSIVSLWEVALKRSSSSGPAMLSVESASELLESGGTATLPLLLQHLKAFEALPVRHGDPFDRMLVAQALQERLRLVTHDRAVASYSDTFILV